MNVDAAQDLAIAAYFWRYKIRYVAQFCSTAEAERFLAGAEDLGQISFIGYEPEPDAAYEDLGHEHCFGPDCPEDAGPSYAEQINAPLSPETIEALRQQLESGEYAKLRRSRKGDGND